MTPSTRNYLSHSEFFAQIDSPNLRIRCQVMRSSRTKEEAFINDVGSIGDGQSFTHIVIGDQYSDTTVAKAKDQMLNFVDGNGVDAGKGLIEQNKPWLDRQAASYFRAPSLTTRQSVSLAPPNSIQMKFLEQCFQSFLSFCMREFQCFKDGKDVFLDGELS